MSGIDFRAEAAALRDEMVARRRDLHRHPELAFEEVRTAALIADELRNLGLEVQTGVGRTGVVGILEGDQDGPTILYRADMDALPIQEENDVDYASQTPGVMHACGHDGHITIALGVAKLLMRQRGQMAGRVKFVFQPAEETGAGARAMIDDGVLIDPAPDVTIGLHLWNPLSIGEVGIAEGAVMAGSSVFQIIIQGRGGHAAMPYTTIDPVVCASQVVMALHALVGRRFNAMEGAVVLSVTSLETSSKAYNVIPDQVEIRGTFRTFDAGVSRQLEQYICETTESLCQSMNCSVKVRVDHQTFPVVNHPEMVARLRRLFGRMIGEDRLDTKARTMAAEDVSFLMNDKPGVFFFLGSSNTDRGLNYGHHHPRFDFDEDALPLGVALMSAALADFVLNDGR